MWSFEVIIAVMTLSGGTKQIKIVLFIDLQHLHSCICKVEAQNSNVLFFTRESYKYKFRGPKSATIKANLVFPK